MNNIEWIPVTPKYEIVTEDNSLINELTSRLYRVGDKLIEYSCEYRTSGGWESSTWDKDEQETVYPSESAYYSYIENLKEGSTTFTVLD